SYQVRQPHMFRVSPCDAYDLRRGLNFDRAGHLRLLGSCRNYALPVHGAGGRSLEEDTNERPTVYLISVYLGEAPS
ncbi:hypothetical protein E4U38_007472, partial [Claviceps purpurea]